MQWSTIKPALVGLVSSIAFDDDGPEPTWHGRPRPLIGDRIRYEITLRITSVAAIGPDETRHDEIVVSGSPALRGTQYGHRRIVLRIEATSTTNTDDAHALHLIENVRTRLRRPSSLETLLAVGLSIVGTGATLDTTYRDGARYVPRATLDVTLLGTVADADPVPVGWIQYALATSHVKDTDGLELPSPPNVSEELIPES